MMITPNPALVGATLLLLATAIVPWFISRWALWARATWRVVAFVFLTALVQKALASPFAPEFNDLPAQRLWGQAIELGWWVVTAQCAIGLTRLFIVFETKPRETRIVSDLLAAVIYLVAVFAIIDLVFAVPIGGLLATSGVIAIVLGLALQNSLSDVFSGIAVGIERPYSVGDLIWVEGGIEGKVIEVNWRSTHIATLNRDVAIVPNNLMAKSRLVNHSMPTTIRGVSITVRLAANERPDRCMSVLTAAVKTCMLLAEKPAPSIARSELLGDGVAYDISFSIPSIEAFVDARTELLGHVQSHLRHAGIGLAVTGVPNLAPLDVPTASVLLQESDWFGILAAEDRDLLAEHLEQDWFATGDRLIKQGDEPQALFILASGTVEITDSSVARGSAIFRLGPGGSLGAIGMITGTPYAATAIALTPVTAYRFNQKAISDALARKPELVGSLEILARRGLEMQRTDLVAHQSDHANEPELFISKLRNFLRKMSEKPQI